MDLLQLAGALLVGHSMGCQVAAEVAARRPDLVCGLVLVAPTSDPGARTSACQIVRMLRGAVYDRSSLMVGTVLDYTRAGVRVLWHEPRQLVERRIEEVLPHVQVPVRVMRGARDRIVPQAWAEEVAHIAGAPTPVVVARSGHDVPYDDPAAVARVTLELAESIQPARPEPSVR